MEVRDPIHGAIALDPAEVAVADHPWVQRLRNIRQTGFSQMAFPGATHTRYMHSLGAMHLAGRAFDQVYRGWAFDRPDARERLRAAVRVAALCHDLGHPPFSHCMEFAMPPLRSLPVGWLKDDDRIATHEDYTVAILAHTPLAKAIADNAPFGARHVASLVRTEVKPGDDFFVDGGLDHRRLLSQIVSSELDVDRMDYLVRDAHYTGAQYGQVDADWLLSNLAPWVANGQVNLAIEGRAVYAFDHFLLARHHMFLMVYFHHKSVVYEEMLRRYVDREDRPWRLPSDLEAYLLTDDIALMAHLREAARDDAWAARIVEQQPYKRVVEKHGAPREADPGPSVARLEAVGIPTIAAASTGRLSHYARIGSKRQQAPGIFVLERMPGQPVERVRPLTDVSVVFDRYAEERVIGRVYVPPERAEEAREVLTGRR
ncbi:MAG: HD domain-containing protein [Myxococcota bacterium]